MVVQKVGAVDTGDGKGHVGASGNLKALSKLDLAEFPGSASGDSRYICPPVGFEVRTGDKTGGDRRWSGFCPYLVGSSRIVWVIVQPSDCKVTVSLGFYIEHITVSDVAAGTFLCEEVTRSDVTIEGAVLLGFTRFTNLIAAATSLWIVVAAVQLGAVRPLPKASATLKAGRISLGGTAIGIRLADAVLIANEDVGRSGRTCGIDRIHLDGKGKAFSSNRLLERLDLELGIISGVIKEHVEIALRVTDTILAGADDGDKVIGEVVLRVGPGSTVEANEVVVGGAGLDLDTHRPPGATTLVVFTNAENLACPRVGRRAIEAGRIDCDLGVVVPAGNLEVLGGVEAHLANIIFVQWVAHATGMVGVASFLYFAIAITGHSGVTREALGARVGEVEIMPHFMRLDSCIFDVSCDKHLVPSVDRGVGGISTPSVDTGEAPVADEDDMVERSRQGNIGGKLSFRRSLHLVADGRLGGV